MNIPIAEKLLKEAKCILDKLGITFWLSTGTCLGAIRDKAIIPYDYDIDIASMLNLHGFTKEATREGIEGFKAHGFQIRLKWRDVGIVVAMKKENVAIDWTCYTAKKSEMKLFVRKGTIAPSDFFSRLKEITFLGKKFFVPSPPEKYLVLAYGADWRISKPGWTWE